jgi:hypothetical protein
MATDSGPHIIDNSNGGHFVWAHGYYNEGTNEVIDIDYPELNTQAQNDLISALNHPEWYGGGTPPGFDQTWGAVGYFIRPRYLDRASAYRPQTLNPGFIPPNIDIGLEQ